ncbi:hypothetical protein [Brevibacillus sp. SYSU BS000544]|uniref:hypothetical protein n=1 Tax=Brevibacillus sp. SYSU BS000544 TaxID=3416443 RepID=UPI003CE5B3F1
MIIGKKQSNNKSNSRAEMNRLLIQMADTHSANMEKMASQNEMLLRELAAVQKNVNEMRSSISRLKPVSPSARRGLFGRRRQTVPVVVENEPKQKLSLPIEDLLPLLPQLGGVIPQLNNPKVKETMKILGNPAVMGMIQQFMANGGLSGLTGKQKVLPSKVRY